MKDTRETLRDIETLLGNAEYHIYDIPADTLADMSGAYGDLPLLLGQALKVVRAWAANVDACPDCAEYAGQDTCGCCGRRLK